MCPGAAGIRAGPHQKKWLPACGRFRDPRSAIPRRGDHPPIVHMPDPIHWLQQDAATWIQGSWQLQPASVKDSTLHSNENPRCGRMWTTQHPEGMRFHRRIQHGTGRTCDPRRVDSRAQAALQASQRQSPVETRLSAGCPECFHTDLEHQAPRFMSCSGQLAGWILTFFYARWPDLYCGRVDRYLPILARRRMDPVLHPRPEFFRGRGILLIFYHLCPNCQMHFSWRELIAEPHPGTIRPVIWKGGFNGVNAAHQAWNAIRIRIGSSNQDEHREEIPDFPERRLSIPLP
jgi:hypothetical protein